MPVRTRSQRLAAERTDTGSSTGSSTTRRRSERLSRRQTQEIKEEEEQFEGGTGTPLISESASQEINAETVGYQRNLDTFREAVNKMLDTPNEPKTRRKYEASPGVDRININGTGQPMDFYIPTKQQPDPYSMRQQIRQTLSSHDQPNRVPLPSKHKSPSISASIGSSSPVYNAEKGLWSPNVPTYNKEYAEEVSKWLLFLIFSILIAVFIACYQEEILKFFQEQMKPMAQLWESLASSISSFFSSLISSSDVNANGNGDIADVADIGDVGGDDIDVDVVNVADGEIISS